MSNEYQRPQAAPGGLRLHLNENTAGPSPAVIEAVRALTADDMAFYPEYDAVEAATAAYLGVTRDRLLLTNGLDEGILAASVAALQRRPADGRPAEAIVPLPAFDMYAISARASGGAVVEVPPRSDLAFQLDGALGAITDRTRLVFVTSPNNPTGVRVDRAAIRSLAGAVPADALVFVDEAYIDFCGGSFLADLANCPNVLVGRTFAKAWGLAALRAGVVVGHPDTLAPLRAIVPPYSLNVCAAAGLVAALADRDRHAWYLAEVASSRERIYGFCRRMGLAFHESGANFVLVRLGERAAAVTSALAARGIHVRDRSHDPGCEGAVRITAGVVAHTNACLAALEEILCGAR